MTYFAPYRLRVFALNLALLHRLFAEDDDVGVIQRRVGRARALEVHPLFDRIGRLDHHDLQPFAHLGWAVLPFDPLGETRLAANALPMLDGQPGVEIQPLPFIAVEHAVVTRIAQPLERFQIRGGFVVVWASAGQDGSAEGVFGQRFDAACAPQEGEFRVNVATLGVQREPAVAADADGGFLVTWQGQDGGNYGVFGRYLSETGTPASVEFRVNTFTSTYQMRPAFAASGAGEFLVVWESAFQDGSGVGVYGQRALRGLFLDSFDSADVCAWSLAVGGGSC